MSNQEDKRRDENTQARLRSGRGVSLDDFCEMEDGRRLNGLKIPAKNTPGAQRFFVSDNNFIERFKN